MVDFFKGVGDELQPFDAAGSIPVDPTWRPAADFVICRDVDGEITACYGGVKWDLNPIRLKANRIAMIGFDSIFKQYEAGQDGLVREVRYLLFCLFFYVQTGHLGRMSAGMLGQYFLTLRTAARYCYDQKANPLVGVISLQQLFSNPAYLNAYSKWMARENIGVTQRKLTKSLISHMVAIGEDRLGYKLHGVFNIDFGAASDVPHQHPVIPTRIYLEVINSVGDWMDLIYPKRKAIERFLDCFISPYYGYTEDHQKTISGGPDVIELEFNQALRLHKLDKVFSGDLHCVGRGVLSSAILKMQWILKTVIHIYTGMRDQEVMLLPYNCIDVEEVVAATLDEDGISRDKPKIVKVLSSTTKFTGYRKSSSWLATDEVVRAVEIARSLCRAISNLFGVRPEDMPLFLNPAIINRRETKVGVPTWNDVSKPKFLLNRLFITESDFQELQATDPSRDFLNAAGFSIGSPWSFTSHQFRRSLAFYGSNSGFISLPSLRKQFKHLSVQMTRYYANNFSKLKTIFGYYDEEVGDFVLPKHHVLFEYQTGMPLNIAYDLLAHAFGDGAQLFGGAGSYISNQRKRMDEGGIHIATLRKETEKQASDGKISFKVTLLGACTYTGKCDSYLLGDITSCLSCADGIIERDKLEEAIDGSEEDLSRYEPGSGEYQVVEAELASLKKFHQKFIPVVEV
ncbi:integrase [Pseudomonas frederiksbergensis]|jgi:integrase|uniref:integrase n=1 Tax=Pseudomonas frederiksbergensis TaxID=104087 RepID=UPI003D251EA2